MNKLIAIIKDEGDYLLLDDSYEWLFSHNKKLKQEYNFFNNYYPFGMASISCLVGENGTGKTTKLNSIFDNFLTTNSLIKAWFFIDTKENIICVTSDNKLKKIYKDNNENIKFENEYSEPYQLYLFSAAIESNQRPKLKTDTNKFDLSNSSLYFQKDFSTIIREDMFNQLFFVVSKYDQLQRKRDVTDESYSIDFSNKKIEMILSDKGQVILEANRYFLPDLAYGRISFKNFEHVNNKISKLKKVICYKYLGVVGSYLEDEEWKEFFKEEITENVIIINGKIEYLNLLKALEAKLLDEIKSNEYIKIHKELEKAFWFLLNSAESQIISENAERLEVSKVLKYARESEPIIMELYSVISMKWQGISSGEFAFLNMFGRFYQNAKKVKLLNRDDLLFIIIDEADLGFHPEWQRGWLTIVTQYFELIFPDREYQMIISTHSPILLSDILDKNVTLLKKSNRLDDEKSSEVGRTFGQNIHTLLSHNFFMDRTIGEFSYKKIKELSDVLTVVSEQLETMLSTNTVIQIDFSEKNKNFEKLEETREMIKKLIKTSFEITEINASVLRKNIRKNIEVLDDTQISNDIFLYRASKYFGEKISVNSVAFKMIEKHIDVIGEEFYRGFLYRKLDEMKYRLKGSLDFEKELRDRNYSEEELKAMQEILARQLDKQGE